MNRTANPLLTATASVTLLLAALAFGGCDQAKTPTAEPGPSEKTVEPESAPPEEPDQPDSTAEAEPDDEKPSDEKPSDDGSVVKLGGGIEIDRKRREVRIPAKLALTDGILEFLIVTEEGRDHESVFTTPVKASMLHLALLTVGLVPHGPITIEHNWNEKALAGPGRINVEVEHEEDGQLARYPVTQLLQNREAVDGEAPDTWIFAGSYFLKIRDKQEYAGDMQDVIASIIPCSEAVVQYATSLTNPYYNGEDDEDEGEYGIAVGEVYIGKVGTEVKLIFSGRGED